MVKSDIARGYEYRIITTKRYQCGYKSDIRCNKQLVRNKAWKGIEALRAHGIPYEFFPLDFFFVF
jgi:hypothetical protein